MLSGRFRNFASYIVKREDRFRLTTAVSPTYIAGMLAESLWITLSRRSCEATTIFQERSAFRERFTTTVWPVVETESKAGLVEPVIVSRTTSPAFEVYSITS